MCTWYHTSLAFRRASTNTSSPDGPGDHNAIRHGLVRFQDSCVVYKSGLVPLNETLGSGSPLTKDPGALHSEEIEEHAVIRSSHGCRPSMQHVCTFSNLFRYLARPHRRWIFKCLPDGFTSARSLDASFYSDEQVSSIAECHLFSKS